MLNRQSGVNMLLSTIAAPIVLAHLIDFLIWRYYVNPLQIWSAMPIQHMNTSAPIYWRWRDISANTIGVVNVHTLNNQSRGNWSRPIGRNFQRFAYSSRQCLFTKLWQPETEKISFKEKRHVQTANNPRSPQCQIEAELLDPSWPPLFSLPSTFKGTIHQN